MSSLTKYELLLHQAVAAEFGIEVITEDVEYTRSKLYQARTAGLDVFEHISMTVSPFNPNALWIWNNAQNSRGSAEADS